MSKFLEVLVLMARTLFAVLGGEKFVALLIGAVLVSVSAKFNVSNEVLLAFLGLIASFMIGKSIQDVKSGGATTSMEKFFLALDSYLESQPPVPPAVPRDVIAAPVVRPSVEVAVEGLNQERL